MYSSRRFLGFLLIISFSIVFFDRPAHGVFGHVRRQQLQQANEERHMREALAKQEAERQEAERQRQEAERQREEAERASEEQAVKKRRRESGELIVRSIRKSPLSQKIRKRTRSNHAGKLQAVVRGFFIRRDNFERNDLAVRIQALARGFSARSILRRKANNIQKIQALARGVSVRVDLSYQDNKARKLQPVIRGYLGKLRFIQYKTECQRKCESSKKIQALVRGYISRKKLRTPIQRLLRELKDKEYKLLDVHKKIKALQKAKSDVLDKRSVIQEELEEIEALLSLGNDMISDVQKDIEKEEERQALEELNTKLAEILASNNAHMLVKIRNRTQVASKDMDLRFLDLDLKKHQESVSFLENSVIKIKGQLLEFVQRVYRRWQKNKKVKKVQIIQRVYRGYKGKWHFQRKKFSHRMLRIIRDRRALDPILLEKEKGSQLMAFQKRLEKLRKDWDRKVETQRVSLERLLVGSKDKLEESQLEYSTLEKFLLTAEKSKGNEQVIKDIKFRKRQLEAFQKYRKANVQMSQKVLERFNSISGNHRAVPRRDREGIWAVFRALSEKARIDAKEKAKKVVEEREKYYNDWLCCYDIGSSRHDLINDVVIKVNQWFASEKDVFDQALKAMENFSSQERISNLLLDQVKMLTVGTPSPFSVMTESTQITFKSFLDFDKRMKKIQTNFSKMKLFFGILNRQRRIQSPYSTS